MTDGTRDRGTTWIFIILVLIVFAVAVTYFSRNNPDLKAVPEQSAVIVTPSRVPRMYTVYYQLNIFSPTNLRIHAGDSVRFQNNGNQPIRVVSDSVRGVPLLAGFDSIGDIQPNGAFTYTFAGAGIFGYHNARNIEETGSVIVKP
jgi:plastocyanin